MDQKVTRRTLLGAGLALPLIAGCGSGSGTTGGTNNTTDSMRGTLSLTLNVPASRSAGKAAAKTRASGGFIPLGTHAIRVTVTDTATGASLAAPQVITDPFVQQTTAPTIINVSFANLPVGSVTVQAIAFPDALGQQTAIATGTGSAQINAGATVNVIIPLQLTLAKLSVTPISVDVTPGTTIPTGSSAPVTAMALDSANKPLLYPLTWLSQNPGIADVTFDPANPTAAIVHGIVDGQTVVTVIEPNSGMTASVDVFVGD